MMRTKQFMVMGALSLLLGTAFAGTAVREGGAADAVTFKRNSQGVNLNQIITQASPPAQAGGSGTVAAMFQAMAGKTAILYSAQCMTASCSQIWSWVPNYFEGSSDGSSICRITGTAGRQCVTVFSNEMHIGARSGHAGSRFSVLPGSLELFGLVGNTRNVLYIDQIKAGIMSNGYMESDPY